MTTCRYCKNLYFGNNPFENAEVVEGVYIVERPTTPIFIPDARVYIWEDICFGKKSFSSF